jgi:Mor family transcriptional regulator
VERLLRSGVRMGYKKANNVLPQELLKEIQKYVQGELIYIPNSKGIRRKWGQNSGGREYLKERNSKIYNKFLLGSDVNKLADEYCLSVDSIRKIIYAKRKDCITD